MRVRRTPLYERTIWTLLYRHSHEGQKIVSVYIDTTVYEGQKITSVAGNPLHSTGRLLALTLTLTLAAQSPFTVHGDSRP